MHEVIAIIRGSPSRAEAKVRLQAMEVAASLLERAIGAEGYVSLTAVNPKLKAPAFVFPGIYGTSEATFEQRRDGLLERLGQRV